MPSNGKRFELPQLTPVNFSLTDGTNIPPPPDSPIEEEKPAPPPTSAKPTLPNPIPTSTTNGESTSAANGVYDGRGRTNGNGEIPETPISPVSSKRPSSIRRFLSRKSLNTNYTNGHNNNISREDLSMMDRPESAMSFASRPRPGLEKKKSNGSWFRKFSGGNGVEGSRTSVIYEDMKTPVKEVKKGPPPPMLPELRELKARIAEDDEGSLGAEDMFKNIK